MYGNRRRKVLFSLIAFSALSGFCFFESGVFDDGAGGGYSPKSKSPAPQGGIIEALANRGKPETTAEKHLETDAAKESAKDSHAQDDKRSSPPRKILGYADLALAAAQAGEAKSGEAKPGEAKSGEAKSGEAKSAGAKSGEAKSAGAKSAGAKSAGAKSAGAKSTAAQAGEAKSGEAKSGEAKSGEAKSGEAKSPGAKSADLEAGAKSSKIEAEAKPGKSQAEAKSGSIEAKIKSGDIDAEAAIAEATNAVAAAKAMKKGLPRHPKFTSFFNITSLSKQTKKFDPENNPIDYATAQIKSALRAEVGLGEAYPWTKNALSKKTPPRVIPGQLKHPFLSASQDQGELEIGQPVPADRARQVWIVTTWRSGSSFFGALLKSYPGTYYSFEPLHYTSNHKVKMTEKNVIDPKGLLDSLFKCRFNKSMHPGGGVMGFYKHASKASNQWLLRHNQRVWNVCENLLPAKSACFLPELHAKVCPVFPMRLIKTVRYRVHHTRNFLEDPELPNLKLLVLVRDPRGVMTSRAKLEWCVSPDCADSAVVCQDLQDDIRAAETLRKEFPGRIHLVRYEDLSITPYDVADDVLDFLDLPRSKMVDNFIAEYTKTERVYNSKRKTVSVDKNPYGLHRNSKTTAFAWRSKVDMTYINRIQDVCSWSLNKLGYNVFHNAAERDNATIPTLVKTAEEVWPSNVIHD